MKGNYVALKRTAEDRNEWQKLKRAGSHTPASQQIGRRRTRSLLHPSVLLYHWLWQKVRLFSNYPQRLFFLENRWILEKLQKDMYLTIFTLLLSIALILLVGDRKGLENTWVSQFPPHLSSATCSGREPPWKRCPAVLWAGSLPVTQSAVSEHWTEEDRWINSWKWYLNMVFQC